MTTKQKLDWNSCGMADEDQPGWRTLRVADEVCAHEAVLPADMRVADALDDYVAGYDAGDCGVECRVRWELWECGEKASEGQHFFISM